MPLYEYRCEETGEMITLLRPMAEADKPVEDPEGKGRTFSRVHSTFAVSSPLACDQGAGVSACPSCRLDGG